MLSEVVVGSVGNTPELAPAEREEELKVGRCLGIEAKLLRIMIAQADVLIVGGTSLVVYPAAGLIDYYNGNKLILINRDKTGRDAQADLVIHDSLGEVLDQV